MCNSLGNVQLCAMTCTKCSVQCWGEGNRTMYNVQRTMCNSLCNVQLCAMTWTICSVQGGGESNRTMYSVQRTMYNSLCSVQLCAMTCTKCSVYCARWGVGQSYNVHCAIVPCATACALCKVGRRQCTMYNVHQLVQCAIMYNSLCTICSVQGGGRAIVSWKKSSRDTNRDSPLPPGHLTQFQTNDQIM